MLTMGTNLIILSKNKLVGVDGVLPVVMELKALYPRIKVVFIFISDDQKGLIQQNYNLWEAVQSLNPSVFVLRLQNKLLAGWRLLQLLGMTAFRTNIFLKDVDALPKHNLVMRILKKISRVIEIKTFIVIADSQCHRKLFLERKITNRRQGRKDRFYNFFAGQYDYFLSTLNREQFEDCYKVQAPKDMVKVGYVRKLPQWQRFLTQAVASNPIANNGPYFLYLLTCHGKRLACDTNEPEVIELVEESLRVLKKFNSRIKTVFKPHAITNVDRLKEVLKKIGYENYVIDYGHPMVLASKAKFVFGNVFSTTTVDAYFHGRPIVEYCFYDDEILKVCGRESYGDRLCQHFIYRDPQQLEKVVEGILSGNQEGHRDPGCMERYLPDTPPEFYDFWKKIFTKEHYGTKSLY